MAAESFLEEVGIELAERHRRIWKGGGRSVKVATAEQVWEPGIATTPPEAPPQSSLETAPEGWSSQQPPPPTELSGREKPELLVPDGPGPGCYKSLSTPRTPRAQRPDTADQLMQALSFHPTLP